MKAEARALVLALGAAATVACGGRAKPTSNPVPAKSPSSTASMPSMSTDSALARLDSMPQVDITIPDSLFTKHVAQVFGDSAPGAVPDSAPDVPTWDIDVRSYESHRRVEHYVRAFTGSARDRFISRLERGSRFEPMIREKLRAGNIPEDMYYLALVESGFDQHAYSRAAAVGVWQFMTATARGTGLRVDWWVDERRDPVRSTDAAVKFLGWLREQFGSLYLAAAAYNGGPGRVARGLSRLGEDDERSGDDAFFALAEQNYLRGETKNYVPQLIAAALVAKDPTRYRMKLRTVPPLAYDSVSVPASTPLVAIAKASGAPLDSIRELNSQVLRGVTPPGGRFLARVPVGYAAGFDSAFAALDPAARTAYTRVEAKKGQTLASIASTAGLSSRQLKWYNPKVTALKSGRLRPGQVVLVPTRSVVSAALDVPDPAIEIYGSRVRGGSRTHVVRRGETLGGIAKRYGTSVSAIVRINGLRKQVIHPGQELLVRAAPKPTPAKRIASSKSAASKSAAKSSATKSRTAKPSAAKTQTKAKSSASKTPAKGTTKARATASRL